jgi:tryptophan 2,3-dioxygenase
VEFTLGHRNPAALQWMPEGSEERRRLEELLTVRSLYDAFLHNLHLNGHPIPEEILRRDLSQPVPEDERVRQVLVRIYREDPSSRDLCERMVDLDEGIQEWRYRHVKMVERTIGTKSGTGGSAGAAYLRSTLSNPAFPALWTVRGRL